ncbi:hypothetical protein [Halovenus halobia]|uniref:hypothetical protein n=1 Tax=Halovenus halobia TaxID=3396622 RepID=UPI003F55AE0D
MILSRRHLLGSCLAGGVALAGCTSSSPESESGGEDQPDSGTEGPQVGETTLRSSFPVEIYEGDSDTRLVQIHWHGKLSNSHWHQQPMDVPEGRWTSYDVRVYDQTGDPIPLGEGAQFSLAISPTEETQDDLIEIEIAGRTLNANGQKTGLGEYRLELVDGDQVLWAAPLLQIEVP